MQAQAHIIVCDMVMEDGEGIETIPRIKKLIGEIPGHPEYLRIFKALGASIIINKPFKIETLIDTINEAIAVPEEN